MMGDRGVSHTLGFVLTFGIIITSIGLVSTVGYDQLTDIRNGEQEQNAERAMQLLHQNVGEIQRGLSIRRSGEIDLNQGSIGTIGADTSRIQVNVTGSNDDYHGEYPMSGVRYQFDDATLVLEGGALLRQDRGGTIVMNRPSFVCTDDRAMVSVVTISNENDRQLSSGTVSIDLRFNESVIHFPRNRTGENSSEGRSDVTVRLHSAYTEGWSDYLASDETGWEPTGTDGEFVCDGPEPAEPGVQRYTVTQTIVNLTYTR